MLKYVVLFCIFFNGTLSSAQGYDRFLHKKFAVKQQQRNTTTLFTQGEELLMYTDKTIQTNCSVTAVSSKGFQLQIITESVTGKMNSFGQEQTFNSAETTAQSPADTAIIQSMLKKVQLVNVQNNQQVYSKEVDTTNQGWTIIPEDVTKYFLLLPKNAVKLGYSWTDSTTIDSSKTVNEYLISKISGDSLQITVYSTLLHNSIVKQQNQLIKQQLKGYSTSERWYDVKNQLLKQEQINTTFNGIYSVDGQSLPITIKINTQIFLKPLL